jgi:hypothetical protein
MKLKPARLFEFQEDFFTVIEKVQEATTALILRKFPLRDEYGTEPTLHCSATAHAKNMGVSDDVVRANNR